MYLSIQSLCDVTANMALGVNQQRIEHANSSYLTSYQSVFDHICTRKSNVTFQ